MKSFKSPQRVILIFLTLFIILCCFLIVRLEIKAANLQSRLDEHHKSLEQNKDVLENLDSFTRKVKNGSISINGENVTLSKDKTMLELSSSNIKLGISQDIAFQYDHDLDLVSLRHKFAHLSVGKTSKGGEHGILIQSSKNYNSIGVFDRGIIIGAGNQNDAPRIILEPEQIKMKKGESIVQLTNTGLLIESSGDINISSKNGNVNIKGKKVKVNE